MPVSDIVELGGPDEEWYIETPSYREKLTGSFVLNTLGTPIWFQTTSGRVYFMSYIISAQRVPYKQPNLNPQ